MVRPNWEGYAIGVCALIGALAPGMWLREISHGHHVGVPGSLLDRLVPFFPTSMLFLAIPYPDEGFVGGAIIVSAVLMNMLLYGVGAYLLLQVLRSVLRYVLK